MNFTGAFSGRDDVDILVIERPDGWLYEVRTENHPTYDEHPYRGSTRHATDDEALIAGRLEAEKLLEILPFISTVR